MNSGTRIASAPSPVKSLRLHEGVVQALVRQIVGGAFRSGTALPIEPELAERFGVSRTVVREAVRVLTAKGLISVKHGSGMWVEPADRWDHLDPLVIFELVRSGQDDALLEELIETRRILEMEIAALAARRRTEVDLESLRLVLDQMASVATDAQAYTELDIVFHEAVLTAARNRLLREALRPVASALRAGRYIAVYRQSVIEHSLPGHEAIFAAIEAGSADDAREAMRGHIVHFEVDIRAGLRAADSVSGADALGLPPHTAPEAR